MSDEHTLFEQMMRLQTAQKAGQHLRGPHEAQTSQHKGDSAS